MATLKVKRAAARRLAQSASQFVTADGVRVHYKKVGTEGPLLLFVHGWACDLTFWRYQAEDFHEQARLLFVDLPGHGQSAKPEVDYSHDRFARALDAVLQAEGGERAVLVGHSAGGSVARHFLRLFPGRAQSLVLVDAALRPAWSNSSDLQDLLALLRAPDHVKTVMALVGKMVEAHTPALSAIEIRLRMLSTPQHVMVSFFEQMDTPVLWRPDPIDLPTLAVLARATHWPADYETFLRGVAGRLDVRWLDEAGHFLMLTQPDAFAEVLQKFLAV